MVAWIIHLATTDPLHRRGGGSRWPDQDSKACGKRHKVRRREVFGNSHDGTSQCSAQTVAT